MGFVSESILQLAITICQISVPLEVAIMGSVKRSATERWRGVRFGVIFVCAVAAFLLSISASQGWIQFSWRGSPILGQPRLEGGVYDLQSIQVLNRALLHLHENYVDPARFSPKLMLAAGLDEVQKQVAEVTVTFDKPLSEKPEQAVVMVGDKKQTFHFKDVDSLWEVGLKYQEIFFFIQENIPPEIERRDIEYTAINGMLKTLDPHSVLLSPKNYQSMVEGNRGNFGGLGITIRMIEGKLLVVNPMQETPASRAGILRGDQIIKIDDVWTQNMDLNAAVSLLRGEPGTQVHLLIARASENWDEPRDFVLTRDTIKIPAVSYAALDPAARIGSVHLKGFQGNTYTDMHDALTTLTDTMGGLNGLVLDLRDNPGGLLEQAIQVSDEFLNDGTIVTTVGSAGKYRKPYPAYKNGTQPNYPIVVLINPGSASASEIVAGALKNHDRAILLGDTSFGKGSVQVLYELQDGSALKLTIAQYLTPGDLSIQSVGVTPDVQLQPMRVQPEGVDLHSQSWVRREATLASHLSHESALPHTNPTLTLPYLASDPPSQMPHPHLRPRRRRPTPRPRRRRRPPPRARPPSAARPRTAHRRTGTRGSARPPQIPHRRHRPPDPEEDLRLTQQLASQQIDWTNGPLPSKKANLDIAWSTNQDPLLINPAEDVTVTVTVTNKGSEPLFRLHGVTESTHANFDDLELAFGKLDPGASLTRSFKVQLDRQQRQRYDHIELKLRASGALPTSDPLSSSRFFIQSQDQTPPTSPSATPSSTRPRATATATSTPTKAPFCASTLRT